MRFGIPKEVQSKAREERRVGLSPAGVAELVRAGGEVFVETGAGEGAGFSDEEYRAVGAQIVYTPEEAYRRADVVVKIQVPKEHELSFVRPNSTIMGFLHLAVASQEILDTFIQKEVTAIGYEVIQRPDGTLPVLKPMSMIAGRMAVQIAGRLLEVHQKGGRGILLGSIPGLPPAEVIIVGAGNLGLHAADSFIGVGARVILVDRDPEKLERATHLFNGKITTMLYSDHALKKLVKFADVVVLAVLVPGERAPILITRDMVKTMKPGSVILDFSIDQGGAAETSRLTPTEDQIYKVDGVIHFAVPNVPSWVARTSTHALTNALLPYLLELVGQDLPTALLKYEDLRRGVYIYKGQIVKESLLKPGEFGVDLLSLLKKEA